MSRIERQQRWRAKKAKDGLVRLDVWVPEDRRASLLALVADLIEFPEMQLVGLKPELEGVKGVQPPSVASALARAGDAQLHETRSPELPANDDRRASDSILLSSVDDLSEFEVMQAKKDVARCLKHCSENCIEDSGSECINRTDADTCVIWNVVQMASDLPL